jgi:hypothetical protein
MKAEDLLEEFKMVEYRMDAEGFHYCFKGYSSFKEVEDKEFHRLRLAYLAAADELEKYVEKRINDLEEEIDN